MRVALSTLFAIITVGTLCICTSQTAKPELSLKATSSQLSSSESGTNSLRPLPHAHTVVIAPTTTLSAPSTSVPAPVATPTITTTTTTTTVPPVSISITGGWTYEAATKVAVCEEGGWVGAASASYPDSLGITAANWYANGGGSCVTPECQIQVAERLQAYPPDQNGCTSW